MTEKMNNSELGAIYTTKILGTLLQNWPEPVHLHCSEVTEIDFDEELLFEGQSYPSEWDICSNLISWLEKEGFIRTGGLGGTVFSFVSVEITMSAMTAINQVPDPLNPDSTRTLKDTLKDIASNGSGKLADKIMDQAFYAFVTMVEKSMGGV